MNFVTVRDLRSQPRYVWDTLAREKEVVITNNGKPTALMVPISDTDFEATLKAMRRAKAKIALENLRSFSEANGLNKMTMDEINAEIAAARAEAAV